MPAPCRKGSTKGEEDRGLISRRRGGGRIPGRGDKLEEIQQRVFRHKKKQLSRKRRACGKTSPPVGREAAQRNEKEVELLKSRTSRRENKEEGDKCREHHRGLKTSKRRSTSTLRRRRPQERDFEETGKGKRRESQGLKRERSHFLQAKQE